MKAAPKLSRTLIQCSNGKRVKFPLYINDKLLSTSISELDLGVRGNNALLRCGCRTIGDLIEIGNLDRVKNIGKKTVDTIMESLAAYQYSLLDDNQKEDYLKRINELN